MSRRVVASLILATTGGLLVGCAGELGPPQMAAQPSMMPGPAPLAQVAQLPPPAINPSVPAEAPPDDDRELIEDDDEGSSLVGSSHGGATASAPALTWSDAELDRRYHTDLTSVGSASIGPASAGALVNGVQMPKSELWQLTDPGRAWGTQETVDALTRCIERVNQRFPGAPPISIGHLSAKNGGHLSPHRSHQSGRDADVGYYYVGGPRSFVHATAENLDLPRTWALVKTALRETTIEMILVDHAVQKVIADYALSSGEDPAFVDEVFQVRGKNARAQIRHVRGHDNHIHFRWHNPVAEAVGRRVARFVVIPHPQKAPPGSKIAAPAGPPPAEGPSYAQIRARSGDTLVILARRYGTTVEEIQHANGMGGNAIRAGTVYRIPQKAPPAALQTHRSKGPARVAARKAPAKPSLKTPSPVPQAPPPAPPPAAKKDAPPPTANKSTP